MSKTLDNAQYLLLSVVCTESVLPHYSYVPQFSDTFIKFLSL